MVSLLILHFIVCARLIDYVVLRNCMHPRTPGDGKNIHACWDHSPVGESAKETGACLWCIKPICWQVQVLLLMLNSNISLTNLCFWVVDNLLLRLSPLFPPQSITRIGHPARILPGLLPTTLDYQTAHSSSGEVVKDVKKELEGHLDRLSKGRKEKGSVKGKERFAMYGDVRELRKEFVLSIPTVLRICFTQLDSFSDFLIIEGSEKGKQV